MKVESAVNLKGRVITVGRTADEIMFKKYEQFNAEMNDTTGVIVDGKKMTLGEARLKWMHDKLDHWIYEGEE